MIDYKFTFRVNLNTMVLIWYLDTKQKLKQTNKQKSQYRTINKNKSILTPTLPGSNWFCPS